jgi:hypothetical protein
MQWSDIERDLTERHTVAQAREAAEEQARRTSVQAGRDEARRQVARFLDRMTASGRPGMVRLVPPDLARRMFERTRSARTSQPGELTLWERMRAAWYERAGRNRSEPGWVLDPVSYTVDGEETRTVTLAVGARGWVGCAEDEAVTLRRGRTIPDLYPVTEVGLPDEVASTMDSEQLARTLVHTMWENGVSVE